MKTFKQYLMESQHNENSLGNPIAQTPEAISNFWRWFGNSRCVDEHGRPLVVFRGQRKVSKPTKFITTNGRYTPSFTDDPHAASVYARKLDTREYSAGSNVMPLYHCMNNPLDLTRYGSEITLDIIADHVDEYSDVLNAFSSLDDLIYRTNARFEIDASDGIYRIKSFEDLYEYILNEEDITDEEIYNLFSECTIDTYLVADSEYFVEALRYKGYDGIIFEDVFDGGEEHYTGNRDKLFIGMDDDSPTIKAYRTFNQNQVKSIFNNGEYSSSEHISETRNCK
jgi:hypothetical protein